MKVMVMVAGGIGAGVAVAAALFFFVFAGDEAAAEEEPEAREPVAAAGRLGPHVVLDDRVFNLQSQGAAPAYLKLQVLIEFETTDERWEHVLDDCVCPEEEAALLEDFEREIGTGRQLMEDAVTTIVSSYSVADVTSPDGKEDLRREIRERVNELMGGRQTVSRVLFLNFITQ